MSQIIIFCEKRERAYEAGIKRKYIDTYMHTEINIFVFLYLT